MTVFSMLFICHIPFRHSADVKIEFDKSLSSSVHNSYTHSVTQWKDMKHAILASLLFFSSCSFTMVGYYSKPIENNIPVYDSILFESKRKVIFSNTEYESKKYNVYQKQYDDLIIAIQFHNEQSLGIAAGIPFFIPILPLDGRHGYGVINKEKKSAACFFVSIAIKKVSGDATPVDIDLCNILLYKEKENGIRPSGYCIYNKLDDVFSVYGMFYYTDNYICNNTTTSIKECNNAAIRITPKEKLTKILIKYDSLFLPQNKGRIIIPPIRYKGKTITIDLIIFKKGTVFFYSPCCIPA